MRSTYFLLLISILLSSKIASAEIGYIYEHDFNDDGIHDSLMSGPEYLFGNGGGPFMLRLSKADGTFSEKVIGLHPKVAALEQNGSNSKIWGYWHMSASEGVLGYVLLDGSFKQENLRLQFHQSHEGLSSKIYDLVFNENQIIKFRKVENYIPPKYEWGK